MNFQIEAKTTVGFYFSLTQPQMHPIQPSILDKKGPISIVQPITINFPPHINHFHIHFLWKIEKPSISISYEKSEKPVESRIRNFNKSNSYTLQIQPSFHNK